MRCNMQSHRLVLKKSSCDRAEISSRVGDIHLSKRGSPGNRFSAMSDCLLVRMIYHNAIYHQHTNVVFTMAARYHPREQAT